MILRIVLTVVIAVLWFVFGFWGVAMEYDHQYIGVEEGSPRWHSLNREVNKKLVVRATVAAAALLSTWFLL